MSAVTVSSENQSSNQVEVSSNEDKNVSKMLASSSKSYTNLTNSDAKKHFGSVKCDDAIDELKKRRDQDLQKNEHEYKINSERYIRKYEEKLMEIQDLYDEILSRVTSNEIPILKQRLLHQKETELKDAFELHERQFASAVRKYEAGEQAIRQTFENDLEILCDKIKADTEKVGFELDGLDTSGETCLASRVRGPGRMRLLPKPRFTNYNPETVPSYGIDELLNDLP